MRHLLIICVLRLPLCAQQDGPPDAPLLWCIEGETPSYLFATLDIPDARLLALPGCVEEALAECGALYAELALDIESQVAMSGRLVLPESGTLKEVLSAELYLRVHKMINELGFPFDGFKTLRIWALTMTLPQLGQLRQALEKGIATQPLDVHLYYRALESKKEVGGLESIEEQIAIFDAMPPEAQVQTLQQALDRLDAQGRGEDPYAGIVECYLAGDLERLAQQAGRAQEGELAAAQQSLFRRRNELLAERIAERMQAAPERSCFFALDCQHYLGEGGLLEMLRAQGLTVSRVQDDGAVPQPD